MSSTVSYVKTSGTGNTGWTPVGGVAAVGKVTCVQKTLLVDTDFMTIGDGLGVPKLYEFDVTGGGVTAGRVAVDVSTATTTAAQVAARLKTAVEANQPSLVVTHNGTGALLIVHKIAGVVGNVTMTENVAATGFVVEGMSGGVDPAR